MTRTMKSRLGDRMPRMARLVVPGYPHHVTQRGSRKQRTFFDDGDYLAYLKIFGETKAKANVAVWAYCLMPNHVHFVAVPGHAKGLAKLYGCTHHRYAARVNSARGWCGHLWQERFFSSVMDECHLIAAVRYIEQNPVRAGLCARAEDWRWSSVHAYLGHASNDLVDTSPMRERIPDWREYLTEYGDPNLIDSIRSNTSTGRPAGDDRFVWELESTTGRTLRRQNPGR